MKYSCEIKKLALPKQLKRELFLCLERLANNYSIFPQYSYGIKLNSYDHKTYKKKFNARQDLVTIHCRTAFIWREK